MEKREQIIVFAYEVKHSVRYDTENSKAGDIVSSIYISKGVIEKPYPKKIKITIEEA